MGFEENRPFKEGTTFFAGVTAAASTDVNSSVWEGSEWLARDTIRNTGRIRKLRVVRNTSTVTLAASDLVQFSLDQYYGKHVAGYTATLAQRGFPVDEALSAGCPVNDLCYIVVSGPALCLTSGSGPTANIAVGDAVVAATAAASTGGTLAGAIDSPNYVTTNSTGVALFNQIANRVGRAMSALTTSNTSALILVDVAA